MSLTKKTCDNYSGCRNFDVKKSRNGGDVILAAIIKNQGGYGRIFGVCGSTIFQFNKSMQNAIDNKNFDFVHMSNETSAVYAAQNYYNKNGFVGAAITTRGPGIYMAMSAIGSSLREELPLVYICGVAPIDVADDFQNIDLKSLMTISKRVFRITRDIKCISKVQDIIDEVFHVAKHGTSENPSPGPVTLMVDSDFWLTKLSVVCGKQFIPKPVRTGNEMNALYEIINNWNLSNSVVMRIGPRVSPKVANLMIKLAEEFPQLYITTVFDARSVLSPDVSDKFLDMSGPVGNKLANDVIEKADLIIDAGVGVLYTVLVIDLITAGRHKNVIRLFDEPIEKTGFMVNVDVVLKYLHRNRDLLESKPAGAKALTDAVVGQGQQITSNKTTASFKKVLDVYLDQNNTIGYHVATCLSQFYNNKLIVTDDYYQVTDSGTAAFITGQLLRMKNQYLDGIYTEFSAIGLSMGSATGKIYGNPKDCVVWLGDGAFINLMSNIIDLKTAAMYNKTRVLVLLFDDKKYGNVALGDMALFKEYTDITSTQVFHDNFSIEAVLKSVGPVVYEDDYKKNFIPKFRAGKGNFKDPGIYIMKINGITTPIVTAQ